MSAPTQPNALASSVLRRKARKTALEDALAAGDPARPDRLVQWARGQWSSYYSGVAEWRMDREEYANEAADKFPHRTKAGERYGDDSPSVFETQNESLNVVAGLAEFASAQAEQDLFGGEPWFASTPVGRSDKELSDDLQRHLQWSLRDGKMVGAYGSAIRRAATLGEVFIKTSHNLTVDQSEAEVWVLHAGGKPVLVDGQEVTDEAAAKDLQLTGKVEWKARYDRVDTVLHDGVEVTLLRHCDVAFREDAPELDLRFTNFYHMTELGVGEAMRRFSLSMEDAIRLATVADKGSSPAPAPDNKTDALDVVYGDDEKEMMLNRRVRLIEGYVAVDPFGDGRIRRMCLVFPASGEDWLVWADYLANISPKGELPISVHIWEEVPDKLYGRGFFQKYRAVQTQVDDFWNQVGYRNRMHSNPVTGYHPDLLESDEDDADLELSPGLALKLKAGAKLTDVIEFMALPDLDSRSMEMLQISLQMVQTRSGISSASQGDLSAVPENNTATGIRSLMSRAAVLLKQPVRGLRRSFTGAFSYAVKLIYANFDRQEAFVWGEGENAEMVEMTPDKVKNLDIDIRLLLTQEHNQTKLQGAQVASSLLSQYIGLPELEKQSAGVLYLQAMKALEFEHPEDIVRKPLVRLEDAVAVLPPEEQQRFQELLAMSQQASQQAPPTLQATPGQPPEQTQVA